MGASSFGILPLPLVWQWHVTYMPNASWRRWGVASARGGGSPTLEAQRKGREGCTSGARKPGETPCGREGEPPLSCFCFCCCSCFSANQGGALRGRNGPAEVGGEGLQSRPQTGRILPPAKDGSS